VSRLESAKPRLNRLVNVRVPLKIYSDMERQMWAVARAYTQEAALYDAELELRDDAVILTNAPFEGQVAICGIEDGKVVQYF